MQQINLYLPHLRHREKAFSFSSILRGSAIFLTGLVLFYLFAIWQTRQLEAHVAQYQQQRDTAQKLLNDLMCALPPGEKSNVLAQEVAQLQADVYNKQQVIAQLAQRDQDNTSGYAAHLEGLARQRTNQLWLTHIGLRGGGSEVELEGSATVAEQVPQYLQRLSQEPVFRGLEFRQFSLTRSERLPQQVDFALHTAARRDTP